MFSRCLSSVATIAAAKIAAAAFICGISINAASSLIARSSPYYRRRRRRALVLVPRRAPFCADWNPTFCSHIVFRNLSLYPIYIYQVYRVCVYTYTAELCTLFLIYCANFLPAFCLIIFIDYIYSAVLYIEQLELNFYFFYFRSSLRCCCFQSSQESNYPPSSIKYVSIRRLNLKYNRNIRGVIYWGKKNRRRGSPNPCQMQNSAFQSLLGAGRTKAGKSFDQYYRRRHAHTGVLPRRYILSHCPLSYSQPFYIHISISATLSRLCRPSPPGTDPRIFRTDDL